MYLVSEAGSQGSVQWNGKTAPVPVLAGGGPNANRLAPRRDVSSSTARSHVGWVGRMPKKQRNRPVGIPNLIHNVSSGFSSPRQSLSFGLPADQLRRVLRFAAGGHVQCGPNCLTRFSFRNGPCDGKACVSKNCCCSGVSVFTLRCLHGQRAGSDSCPFGNPIHFGFPRAL